MGCWSVFADDAVVMCRTREQAEAALMRLRELLAELGLEPKEAKTRIMHLKVGGEGLDFLGFHHRWVRAQGRTGGKGVEFLARWPSGKAMQHARDRIRGLTGSNRTLLSVDVIVWELGSFLRGWAGYFRYGNSSARFTKIRHCALTRVVGMLAKKHRRSRRFGMWVVSQSSDNQLGLISLDGIGSQRETVWFTSGFATYRRSRSPRQLSTLQVGKVWWHSGQVPIQRASARWSSRRTA